MIVYPAIDLLGGRVVRLLRGNFDDATIYGDDPAKVAVSFAREGASWVHVVDLDAARTGDASNRGVIADIVAALDGRARVQTGGGVRTLADVAMLAEVGVSRVVMGSAAVAEPALVAAAASVLPVAVGLDHRAGVVATHGWTATSGRALEDLIPQFPDAAAFIVTDIERDGTLGGPDVSGMAQIVASSSVPVIASGGVGSTRDLEALAAVEGLAGVVVGKALYEGALSLREAIGICRARQGRST